MHESVRHDAAPQIECADTLGRIKLMAGERERIHAERLDVYRQMAHCLHAIRVEEYSARAAKRSDLSNRLDGADLIVRKHHAHDTGRLIDCLRKCRKGHFSLPVHGKIPHGKSLP